MDDFNYLRKNKMIGFIFEYDKNGKKELGTHFIMNSMKIKPDRLEDLNLLVFDKNRVVCLDIINLYINSNKRMENV